MLEELRLDLVPTLFLLKTFKKNGGIRKINFTNLNQFQKNKKHQGDAKLASNSCAKNFI